MYSQNSLQAAFQHRLESHADQRSLAYFDSERNYHWYDFRSVVTQAAGPLAALYDADHKPGDVCIIVMSDPKDTSPALLAVLLAGGIPLLIAPPVIQGANSSLPAIFQGVLEKTKARTVIYANRSVADALNPRQKQQTRPLIANEIPSGELSSVRIADRPSGAIAAMQLTSGTTGFPRICVWTHEKVQAALNGMMQAMELGPDDCFLNWTPLYHDMGLVNNYLLCLVHGIPLVLLSPFDLMKNPALWLQALSDTGATTSWSPNFGFALVTQRATERQLSGIRLDRVRGLWNAAERIHYETLTSFQQRFEPYGLSATALKTNFGCAENIGGATFSAPDDVFQVETIDPHALHQRREAIPADDERDAMVVVGVGKPHPGITIEILDNAGSPLPDGKVGEVALRSNSRMEGYLADPDATAHISTNGLLKTGDLGYLRDGELFWTGRTRECIAYRGRKIDPSDFEAPLLTVDDLRPGCFVAFGIDDPASGTEKVVLVSEAKDDTPRSSEVVRRVVVDAIARQLGFLAIGDFVMVARGTLTKTSSGKRRHRHFRDLYVRGELERYRVGSDQAFPNP